MSYAADLLHKIQDKLDGKRPTELAKQELKELQFDIASQLISGNMDYRLI